jgi:VanZ family protein
MRGLMSGLWLPVVAYMAAIFVLSSLPTIPPPLGLRGIDKPEHYIAYAGLAAIVMRAVRGTRPGWRLGVVAVVAIAISAAYGATDELHQFFVPTRCCDILDWTADVLGAITGAGLMSAASYLRRGR